MKSLREIILNQFDSDEARKKFLRGLEKVRISIELRYCREKLGLSRKQLSNLSGVSQSTIYRLENPFYDGYSVNSLNKIKNVINLFHK